MSKFDRLLPMPGGQPNVFKWATVTDDSPLTIRLDNDADPLDGTPDTLVASLAVNDRVLVLLITNDNPARAARRPVIIGRSGG